MSHRRLVIHERITAIIGSAILLGLVAMSYYYSIQLDIAGLKYIPSESSPDFTARNVSLIDFDEAGTPKERLEAKSMQHFSDERMSASDARFMSLDPNRAPMTARADEAWSNDGLETVELSGRVVLRQAASEASPELFFKTEYLKGWLDTHRFETDRPVYMRRGTDTAESQKGMMYDNVARTVELRDRVHSLLHPKNFRELEPAQNPKP